MGGLRWKMGGVERQSERHPRPPPQPNTRARARQLSEMIESGLLLAGWWVMLCNHSIKAKRERESESSPWACRVPHPLSWISQKYFLTEAHGNTAPHGLKYIFFSTFSSLFFLQFCNIQNTRHATIHWKPFIWEKTNRGKTRTSIQNNVCLCQLSECIKIMKPENSFHCACLVQGIKRKKACTCVYTHRPPLRCISCEHPLSPTSWVQPCIITETRKYMLASFIVLHVKETLNFHEHVSILHVGCAFGRDFVTQTELTCTTLQSRPKARCLIYSSTVWKQMDYMHTVLLHVTSTSMLNWGSSHYSHCISRKLQQNIQLLQELNYWHSCHYDLSVTVVNLTTNTTLTKAVQGPVTRQQIMN